MLGSTNSTRSSLQLVLFTTNHSIFVKKGSNSIVIVVVYVDDILISGNDNVGIVDVKKYLQGKFVTKDLGLLRYFLGIEIARSK